MKFIYILLLCILSCYPWGSYGARYTGKNANDAGVYLDNSQGKRGFGFRNPGHARNHVSSNQPPSVQTFSKSQQKSGFDTSNIQNEIAHRALTNGKVKAAMDMLNKYDQKLRNTKQYMRQAVALTYSDLNLPDPNLTGGEWINGKKIKNFNIRGAVIVLQHYAGKESDPSAPVHIETFYPK